SAALSFAREPPEIGSYLSYLAMICYLSWVWRLYGLESVTEGGVVFLERLVRSLLLPVRPSELTTSGFSIIGTLLQEVRLLRGQVLDLAFNRLQIEGNLSWVILILLEHQL